MSPTKTPGRPRAHVPMDDMKGLRTLIDDGMSQPEMAAYYGVSQSTISRLIKELMDDEDGKCKR